MGLTRHLLLTTLGGLFLVFLFSMNLCLTINSSLNYHILKPSVMSLSEEMIIGEYSADYIDKEIEFIKGYCKNNSDFVYEFQGESFLIECEQISEGPNSIADSIISQNPLLSNQKNLLEQQIIENYKLFSDYCEPHSEFVIEEPQKLKIFQEEVSVDSIKIDCDVVDNNSEDIIKNAIGNYFDKIYFRNYQCEFSIKTLFFDCFSKYKSPFFLISEQSREYWHNKFIFLLIINIVLAIAMFLFIEKKSNWFFLVGILSLISSLPFFNMGWLMFIIDNKYLEIYKIFITQHYQIFWMSFLFGIIMIGLGIAFKFFKLGIYISGKLKKINKKFNKREKDSPEENKENKESSDSKDKQG